MEKTEAIDLLRKLGADDLAIDFPLFEGDYPDDDPPGREPKMFATGIVSTKNSGHGCVTISPDMKELYWSTSIQLSDSGYSSGIVFSMKKENGRWTAPGHASFSRYETVDDVPFFAPDGKRLYFISRRPLLEGGQRRGEKIWFVDRNGDGWSAPHDAGESINSQEMHWQFAVTGNRNIYFGSSAGGGMGMGDIYL